MSLRYALLALLTAQPMTGYDLAKVFHSSVGHVWHAPDSQIYPELRRMEADGVVSSADVPWGSTTTKREYSITPVGVAAFRSWMTEPLEYARDRDPAHLRAAYFEWTDTDSARAHLTAHRAHFESLKAQWQEQLEAIRDRTHPVVARRLSVFPPAQWDRIVAYKAFAYEGLVDRADHEIAWAIRGLALIDTLE
ncbi:MAG: PadR family transcriptional regulator [Pseudolysinimonas sp.]